MVTSNTDKALRLRQEAAERAYDRMLQMLVNFGPVGVLKVEDVKVIAQQARLIAFDAMDQVKDSSNV